MPEDCHFDLFLERIGLTMWEASSAFAVGYHWRAKDWNAILSRNYTGIRLCDRNPWRLEFCRELFPKYSDLVFIHDNFHRVAMRVYSEFVNSQPRELRWWSASGFPVLCWWPGDGEPPAMPRRRRRGLGGLGATVQAQFNAIFAQRRARPAQRLHS
jgi:hypothetical protein